MIPAKQESRFLSSGFGIKCGMTTYRLNLDKIVASSVLADTTLGVAAEDLSRLALGVVIGSRGRADAAIRRCAHGGDWHSASGVWQSRESLNPRRRVVARQ